MNRVSLTKNNRVLFDGKPVKCHRGYSGGYRQTYITSDYDILKMDYINENSWLSHQTEGEITLFMDIYSKDYKFFPTIKDCGTYMNEDGDEFWWVLQKYEKEVIFHPDEYTEKVNNFSKFAADLIRKYELSDISIGKYTFHNLGIKNGMPFFYDFGGNKYSYLAAGTGFYWDNILSSEFFQCTNTNDVCGIYQEG
jgi:hypothetical protein